jgi:hypothetical protein
VATLQERQTERGGIGSWSRTRWLVVLGVAAVIVGIALIAVFAGGGGGAAPGY